VNSLARWVSVVGTPVLSVVIVNPFRAGPHANRCRSYSGQRLSIGSPVR
jgi:hypothetical protein